MKTIIFLLQKEFKQIFRNKAILPIIFVMPFVQLILLSNAATFDIKNLKIWIVDKDMSPLSRTLISKFQASNYFKIAGSGLSEKEADLKLKSNAADLYLVINKNFERELFKENKSKTQLVFNAIDGTKASLATVYTSSLIQDFNANIKERYKSKISNENFVINNKSINITYSNWFNPELNYKTFMVPGLIVLLVTMIGTFLTSMNIVREKEIGTIEQINVTPIKKYHFIIGKLLPFWIIGLMILGVGLTIGKVLFQIPYLGSIALIYAFASIYMIAILGLGLFISNITETQQQAMFIAWFILIIFILLSGLFTAIENMPYWAQQITRLNPVRYFIEVNRMVLLKGAGFTDVKYHFAIISIFALVINSMAIIYYKKTSA